MNDTDDKKKYQRLFTKEEFAKLTRDGMYQALCYVSPTLARGRSRAKKEELIELYQDAADTDSIPVLEVKEDSGGNVVTEAVVPTADPNEQDATLANPPTIPVVEGPSLSNILKQALGEIHADQIIEDEVSFMPDFSDEAVAEQKHQDISMSTHVHGPDCGHDHPPQLAGMDDLVRVNPEMPSAMMQDGAVIQLQPEGEPMFTFKDAPRELTSKEQVLLDRLRKNFDIFTSNVVNNEAKRNVRADIYALKVCGIIANPKFEETIKSGRDHVRELRRKWKAGVDIAEAVKEGNQESKLKSAIAGAMGSGT